MSFEILKFNNSNDAFEMKSIFPNTTLRHFTISYAFVLIRMITVLHLVNGLIMRPNFFFFKTINFNAKLNLNFFFHSNLRHSISVEVCIPSHCIFA